MSPSLSPLPLKVKLWLLSTVELDRSKLTRFVKSSRVRLLPSALPSTATASPATAFIVSTTAPDFLSPVSTLSCPDSGEMLNVMLSGASSLSDSPEVVASKLMVPLVL